MQPFLVHLLRLHAEENTIMAVGGITRRKRIAVSVVITVLNEPPYLHRTSRRYQKIGNDRRIGDGRTGRAVAMHHHVCGCCRCFTFGRSNRVGQRAASRRVGCNFACIVDGEDRGMRCVLKVLTLSTTIGKVTTSPT